MSTQTTTLIAKFDNQTVTVGDRIYTVTSAPQRGSWGGYKHAAAYEVRLTADGKRLKLELVWTGDDVTSDRKAWDLARDRAERTTPLSTGGRRILASRGGKPSLTTEE